MSLRLKLALAFAIMAAAMVLVVGTVNDRVTHSTLTEEVKNSLDVAWDVTARRENAAPPGRDPRAIPRGASGLALQFGFVGQTFDADGTLRLDSTQGVLSFPSTLAARAIRTDREVRAKLTPEGSDEPYHLLVRSLGERRALLVAKPVGEIDTALQELRQKTFVVGIALALMGAALGLLIANSLTRRLRALERAARFVADTGDLGASIEAAGKDETASLATSFAHMLATLKRSRDQQQQLIQDAGHELRTPLTSIRTNLYALRTSTKMDDATKTSVLSDLESETAELTHLINEVIELATDQRSAEPFEPISLVDVVDSVIARMQPATDRVLQRTASSADRDQSVVNAQRGALERAVRNLVENALKFDTSEAAIEIEVHANGIDVCDRGPGVSAEDADHVFDRFYRGTHARAQPGSGLGLAIVFEIVSRHGGSCHARSREDGGAAIGFSIPAGGASTDGTRR